MSWSDIFAYVRKRNFELITLAFLSFFEMDFSPSPLSIVIVVELSRSVPGLTKNP